MSHQFLIVLMLLGLATTPALRAQDWDATRQASGWAFQEVDGSLVFFDPAARSLRTWMKGNGLLTSLTVSMPETRKPAIAVKPAAAPSPRATSDYDAAGDLLYGISRHQRPRTKPVSPGTPETPAPCEAIPERWVLDSYNRTWMICGNRLAVLGKDGKPEIVLQLPAAGCRGGHGRGAGRHPHPLPHHEALPGETGS